MKRRLLASATLVAVLGLAAAPADAAVSGVGWWTRNPTASAPEGGLQVANAPDGVISYGAIRVAEDGEDIESGVLTLQESDELNAAGATLRACPAAGTWSPGQGALADGPKADCAAGSVDLTRNETGQWTADVTSVLDGSTPAVAVVPAEGAGVFQVSFEAPKLEVVTRRSSGSGSGSSTSDFDTSEFTASPTTTSPSSSGGSSDSFSSGSSTFESSSATSFSASSPITTDASVAESVAPSQDAAVALDAAAATEDDTSGSTFTARPAAAPPLGAGGNRWAQYGLFLAVAAVIGTIAGVGRNRLLGGSA